MRICNGSFIPLPEAIDGKVFIDINHLESAGLVQGGNGLMSVRIKVADSSFLPSSKRSIPFFNQLRELTVIVDNAASISIKALFLTDVGKELLSLFKLQFDEIAFNEVIELFSKTGIAAILTTVDGLPTPVWTKAIESGAN